MASLSRFLLPVSLIILAGCSPSERAAGPSDDVEQRIARIENGLTPNLRISGREVESFNINDRLKELNIPGVSIAFAEKGVVSWARAYGFADLETQQAMTAETLLLAGSISKPVAALRALQLVEDGTFGLDENINAYLDSWSVPENEFTASEKVTLRRILNHTAGLTVWGFPGYDEGDEVPSVVDVLDGKGNTDAVRVYKAPGESWQYSGGGYTVMQLAITDTVKAPFPETMRDAVLTPLVMPNSTFENPLPAALMPSAAVGYRRDGSEVEGKRPIYPEMAAAGLWTTPSELIQYAIEIQTIQQSGEDGILAAQTVGEMLTPGMNEHGLGPVVEQHTFGHGGADEGFRADLTAWKNQPYAVVIMVNSDNGKIIREILLAIAAEYDLPGVEPVVREITDVAPGSLAKFTGSYSVEGGGTLEVTLDGERLLVDDVEFGYSEWAYPQSDNTFFGSNNGAIFTFEVNDGIATGLEAWGMDASRVQASPAP